MESFSNQYSPAQPSHLGRPVKNAVVAAVGTLLLTLSGVGHAALHDRGGGLLYDDVLNVTWLQDANYAFTSGYDADGLLNWKQAVKWAADLNYTDTVRGVVYSDWRLPHVLPVNGSYNGKFSFDGSTDEGYNTRSPNSELAYMYFVNLGLKAYYAADGSVQADFGAAGMGRWGSANVGPVKNLRSSIYWTGSVYAPHPTLNSWMFDAHWGYQNFYSQWDLLYVWAVRDGDVAGTPGRLATGLSNAVLVPESPTWALMGLGLVATVARLRRLRHARTLADRAPQALRA